MGGHALLCSDISTATFASFVSHLQITTSSAATALSGEQVPRPSRDPAPGPPTHRRRYRPLPINAPLLSWARAASSLNAVTLHFQALAFHQPPLSHHHFQPSLLTASASHPHSPGFPRTHGTWGRHLGSGICNSLPRHFSGTRRSGAHSSKTDLGPTSSKSSPRPPVPFPTHRFF